MKRDRVILWGSGTYYNKYITLIKKFEENNILNVVGIYTRDCWCTKIDGYKIISNIEKEDFDYIIIMSPKNFHEMLREAVLLGVEGDRLIRVDVLGEEGFTFEKWKKLYDSRLSIIAMNCWGGVTYNYLGLPFLSPFINMFETENEFISFLRGDIKSQLLSKIKFEHIEYQSIEKIVYPVYSCNGLHLYMNHYYDFQDAEDRWYERCGKINYNNLFVMASTESPAFAEQFSELKYEKKICFTSFPTKIPFCLEVTPYVKRTNSGAPFWEYVIGIANGKYPFYDTWELLMNGRIVLRGNSE